MMNDKVLTLRGKRAVWAPGGGTGPIDPKRLPEGYPYKEQSESEIVVLAETAVDVKNHSGYGIGALIPSDYVPFVEGQKYFATWNGVRYETVASVFPTGPVGLMIETESGIVGIGDNAEYSAYSIEAGPGAFIGGGADTVSISTIGVTETIHTMAEEFLPAVMVEFDAMNSTHNANISELYAAAKSGKIVMCRGGVETEEATQYVFGYFSGYVKQGETEGAIFVSGMSSAATITLMSDGTVQTGIFGE